jgi:hypothetical protein
MKKSNVTDKIETPTVPPVKRDEVLNTRNNNMIIYQIKLPKTQDAEAFVTFMREEYFPAVHKGSTRVGEVTDLRLLERENEIEGDNLGNDFFWHVGWSGQPTGQVAIDDEAIARKFEAFEAKIKRVGFYEEVAGWHKGHAQ